MPVVPRPCAGSFQLVGNIFVRGIMHREALSDGALSVECVIT